MATIYNIQVKIISDFCAYPDAEIAFKVLTALNKIPMDPNNGLTLRIADIRVNEKNYPNKET